MDLSGLLDSITTATYNIDYGRKGLATEGSAEEGRISFRIGISEAITAFKDAHSTRDPYTIILAEYTFLTQELRFCEKTDTDSYNSLIQAIQYFDDAFNVLKVAEEKTLYHIIDIGIPHNKKYRVKGYPKDSFHIALSSHITRINNMLRTTGIGLIEKTLLKQRKANMSTAINAYVEKQKLAMADTKS